MGKRPPLLKKGDTIAITATARKISEAEIQPAAELFRSWGLKVKVSSTLHAEEDQFAGSDALRLRGLQELMDDKEVKAIICARGGYGTVRIIDNLSYEKFAASPKWIIGYSDITVLHSHIHTHYGIETLHAPMAFNIQESRRDEESILSLEKALFTASETSIASAPDLLNIRGQASGELVGGNLSVLFSLIGSASDLDTNGKILFLEDLDEYLYHIDRMMVALKRSGKLSGLAGMVVGDMSDMKDNAIPFRKTAYEIIHEHTHAYGYPVVFGFPAGHEKRNLALKLGAMAKVEVNDKGGMLVF